VITASISDFTGASAIMLSGPGASPVGRIGGLDSSESVAADSIQNLILARGLKTIKEIRIRRS
jgi:hypothetical protein